MIMTDIATTKTNMAAADFWVIIKGPVELIGTPVKEFAPEHIGVRVFRPDIIIPEYLFYAMKQLHSQGYFKKFNGESLAFIHFITLEFLA